ncbi:MAG: hypothetical protein K9G11_01465 [Rickettsiaceae bacterium]|nr:hypothetical protein [Rickettsiaceae bacterium]
MAKDNNQGSSDKAASTQVKQQSPVESRKSRNILFLGVFGIVFLFIVYNLYNALVGDGKDTKTIQVPTNVPKPPTSDNTDINVPQLPQLPKLVAPVAPLTDVKVPNPPNLAPPSTIKSPEDTSALNLPKSATKKSQLQADELERQKKAKEEAKRKASIMVYGGTAAAKKDGDGSSGKDAAVVDFTDISKNAVSFKAPPEYLLVRGKIIDAIIETSIHSSVGGEIRAIISRDVYSQGGKVILIPKGSRAIGSYSTGTGTPLGTINVNWERIDLVNGHVVKLDKTRGVNNLGMNGVAGDIDYKTSEKIANTIISSAINIASAVGLDKIAPVAPTTTTTSSSNSATTTAATAVSTAFATALATTPAGNNNIKNALCTNVLTAVNSLVALNTTFQNIATTLSTVCVNGTADDVVISTFKTNIPLLTSTGTTTTTDNSATGKAAQQAYTDINNTIKGIIQTQDVNTVVTIPQGTIIKMYVGQDIEFPKASIDRVR